MFEQDVPIKEQIGWQFRPGNISVTSTDIWTKEVSNISILYTKYAGPYVVQLITQMTY